MYKSKSFFMIFMIIAVVFAADACSSDSAGKATVNINTGLGNADKYITKAPAPSNVGSISIIVTDADGTELIRQTFSADGTVMEGNADTSVTYSPDGVITLTMSPGLDITFTVVANANPSDPGVVTEWTGSATQTLAAGEEITIPIEMSISGTKILIPDYSGQRLVQIDDMSGNNWYPISGTDLSFGSEYFQPADVEIDSIGRIYIANNTGDSMTVSRVLRMSDIKSKSYENIVTNSDVSLFGVNSVAIDHDNNYVYYTCENSNVYRRVIDPLGAPETVNFSSIFDATYLMGIDVDNNGNVYLSVRGTYSGIIKFAFNDPPATSSETNKYTYYQTSIAGVSRDVEIKGNYIYLASNYDNSVSGVYDNVSRLTLDLKYVDVLSGNTSKTDNFHGPHRFLATLNSRFYLIDEDETVQGASDLEGIVAFDDITGAGWERFDPAMVGQSAFSFYGSC